MVKYLVVSIVVVGLSEESATEFVVGRGSERSEKWSVLARLSGRSEAESEDNA